MVVSVTAKGETRSRQVSAPELNKPKPLLTCRNSMDVTKTRVAIVLWEEESGGGLQIGQTVTGI